MLDNKREIKNCSYCGRTSFEKHADGCRSPFKKLAFLEEPSQEDLFNELQKAKRQIQELNILLANIRRLVQQLDDITKYGNQ